MLPKNIRIALVILWSGKDSVEEYWFQHRIQSWIINADTKDIENMNAWPHMVSTGLYTPPRKGYQHVMECAFCKILELDTRSIFAP